MAFDLKKLNNQTWQIFDQTDQLMYSGSLESCRDWLDLQEGRQQKSLLEVMTGWFSKSALKAPLATSSQSTSESGVLN